MDENPYQAPGASLEGPEPPSPEAEGPLLPWEVPSEGGALARALATVRLMLGAPEEAGTRLARSRAVGKAGTYYALAGLPFQWVAQVVMAAGASRDAQTNAWMFRFFHLPEPPPPTPEQAALQKVIVWVTAALTPFLAAIGIVIAGLVAHAGLWMVKGLAEKRGLETTFRVILYMIGSTAWLGLVNSLGVFLPPAAQPFHALLSGGVGLGILTYQGMVLGYAHGIKPGRGVLAVFMPLIIAFCCAAACLLPLILTGAARG